MRAAFSKLSQTIVTVWIPRFSSAAASSTLPDVHEPQRPMPTTAALAVAAASSMRAPGEGAVPDGFTSRRTVAPWSRPRSASRCVVNGMSRLSSTSAMVAPASARGRAGAERPPPGSGQTGLRISMGSGPPDRAGDREAPETAPAGQHRREVAAAARHHEVDVVRLRGDRNPGGGIVEVVAERVAAGVALHLPELLVHHPARPHLGDRSAG